MTTSAVHQETVDSWVTIFERLDKCPWPGPRPLGRDDEALLVGRGDDRNKFLQEVDLHRLVILTGESGVGKSSLLDAGLVRDLEDNGSYETAIVRQWGAGTDSCDNAVDFLAGKLRASLSALGHRALPHGSDLFWALDDRFGEGLVVILDQFEELMRFDPALKEGVLDLLVDINKTLRTKFVISLRGEYLHELRKLEREATPFSLSRFMLEAVDPAFAMQIIRAPEHSTPTAVHVIDEAAVADIAARWQAARDAPMTEGSDPFGRVGLLHLQALLYVLHDRAMDDVVTAPIVESFAEEVEAGRPEELFRAGMELAVDVKLSRCRTAFAKSGVDDYRLEGVQSLLVRTAPKLSSGSYKVVISAQELAHEVIGAERALLVRALASARQTGFNEPDHPAPTGQVAALENLLITMAVDEPERLLTSDRRELAARADLDHPDPHPWVERLHEGASPAAADPDDFSCGPVAGLAPAAVLIEELRRYALTLAWLEITKLVRITRPGGTRLMISLIHDGFGEALRRWSDRRRARFPAHEALHALTVPLGAHFDWGRADVLNGGDTPRVFANMRWRGDTITATFRHVVFVNCDFRGSMFKECAFEGVTFLNCRLDGTLLSDCRIIGDFADATGDWWEEEPEFTVSAEGNTLIDALAFYQRVEDDLPHVFLAQHIGKPAVAATPDLAARAKAHVTPERGGLCVVGGRLSAFTMRSTEFCDGGRFSLRHVAGSGLDIVEQRAGAVEIFGSGVRHVTMTTADDPRPTDQVELLINASMVVQTWVGAGMALVGRAMNSRLVQFFNATGDGRMRIDGDTIEDLCVGLSSWDGQRLGAAADRVVVMQGRRMDYARRSAAETETVLARVPATSPVVTA